MKGNISRQVNKTLAKFAQNKKAIDTRGRAAERFDSRSSKEKDESEKSFVGLDRLTNIPRSTKPRNSLEG